MNSGNGIICQRWRAVGSSKNWGTDRFQLDTLIEGDHHQSDWQADDQRAQQQTQIGKDRAKPCLFAQPNDFPRMVDLSLLRSLQIVP